ncbi:glycosyl hydrolase, family 57 [Leyella stercorea DSM 18206]|jgi:alpha-amylase|uniref:Glycosyl hydrolase, family 57 n=1 Tax=Leyella stercorea DSM 18206 TaxID=1002367 RepID=G6B0B8_9BACT|nr:glycoside hydrolase family 57 protein [Leyella stercorea]EHJ37792.1 glycosyl hydrolase, family 57 [Leyella stercorea DSM 18206]HAH77430.1 alpha-amylase [Leyella stercorea]
MKTICLYFEIHQNIQLKRYRFFDIGTDHYYYDDYEDERLITDVANRSYMPALEALGEMLKEHPGFFKVAFSLSGVGMEQLEIHAPQVLEKLQELNQTGCVEFLAEPYSHGLASLANEESFAKEVKRQCQKMKEYFGKEPKVLRNSSLIYSDDIGAQAAQMGFKGMLTEGARHVLGWKSPHYVYNCALAPNLKLLLRDVNLSDDISLRFSNVDWEGYPLFADNYVDRIANFPGEEHVVNIFMELSALGVAQPLSSNILDFLKALPECAKQRGLTFSTPSEICDTMPSVGALDVPDTLSWTDEERDVSSWLGNPMQREAFNKLYSVADRVRIADDPRINQDWDYLQASNNFRQMTTKPSQVGIDRGIYASPFDAFTNYMNILGDFIARVNSLYPESVDNDELASLLTTIKNQDEEIEMKNKEITRLQTKIEKIEAAEEKLRAKLEKTKAPKAETAPKAKKPAAKKPKSAEVKEEAKETEPKKA